MLLLGHEKLDHYLGIEAIVWSTAIARKNHYHNREMPAGVTSYRGRDEGLPAHRIQSLFQLGRRRFGVGMGMSRFIAATPVVDGGFRLGEMTLANADAVEGAALQI